MVAVFSGNGLGLFNSSATQLGGAAGGSGQLGQTGSRYRVNLATGNLVLQEFDESILTRGLPIAFVRTYNSRGLVSEGGRQTQVGQDGWLHVFERRVSNLTGTVNTVGSTVTRTLGDGSEVVYTWDASRSAYVSTAGDGAHDTLTWNGTNSRWTWTEGTTRDQEVYDASGTNGGRLMTILNARSGAQYDVSYTAAGPSGLVSSIYSSLASGDGLSFTYTSGRLTRVSTREGGVTRGQVDYGYDGFGRLTSVTADLTLFSTSDNTWSGTASANDGKLFRTSYTYESATDGNNLRVASVAYSDGMVVSFGYDGSGRVTRSTIGDTNGNDADGLGQTTTYAYGTTAGGLTPVTVTDASGRAWTYRFDATTRELREIHAPAVGGVVDVTRYTYDASGNVQQVETTRGATTVARTTFTYDSRGNALSETDLLGNRVDRTFDASNQLLTETRYTAANPDTSPTNYQPTTRYVYDTASRLRFTVNAQGEVTEYLYGTTGGANGQVTTMRRYTGATYAVATLANNASISLSAMTTWTSGKLAATERTDYVYDAMGRLQESRVYAQVAQSAGSGVAVGDGVLDAATDLTYYSYDAQGLLRQQVTLRGTARTLGGAAQAGSQVVDYMYDGMGRLLSVLSRNSSTAAMPDPRDPANATAYATWLASNDATTVMTTYVYTDSGNRIAVTSDNGMTRTEVRNANGQVVSVIEADAPTSPTVTRTTQFRYDAAGRLVAQEDATGARQFMLYDEKGQLAATVDATGAVVENIRDALGRVVETRRYANRVTPQAAWWTGAPPAVLWRSDAGTPPGNALVVTVDATRDQVTQATYDGAGRLVTERLVGVDSSQTRLTTYTYDGAHRLTQVTVSDGAGTAATARTTRYLYDRAGRQVATVDADGYVTETQYDNAGRAVKVIRYANTSANAAANDVAGLRPATLDAARDQVTRYFHDGRGQQVGMLDAEGYLTEFVHDEALNQRAVRAYTLRLTGLTGNESFANLKATASANPAVEKWRDTQRAFNALGQLATEVNHEGTVTQYTYDEAGRLVKTSQGSTLEQVRDGYLRYDVFGNLTGELSGEGAALLTAGLSQAQIDALYAQYGVRHSYDLLGRRTESIDAAGNKTWYVYDAAGRQTFVVRGVHDGANLQNAQGEVVETRYDAFGQVIDAIAYTGRITLSVPGSRDSVLGVLSTLSFVASSDSRTQFAYDRRGLLAQRIDAEGYRTTYGYNAFGELATRQDWELDNSLRLTSTTTYGKRGLVTGSSESGGALVRSSTQVHDAFGRVTQATDARGNVTTFAYDRLGRMVTQTAVNVSGRNEATSIAYDAFGRVLTQTDAVGKVTTYSYSDAARSVTVTSPEGVTITTARNRFGQVVTVTQPLPGGGNAVTTTQYDRDGRVTSVTDPLGKVSSSAYDARGLLTTTTDATGRQVEYRYDAAGRVLQRIEDPGAGKLNLTTTFAYDGQGRQVTVTDASGRVTSMAYDRKGQLVETVRDPAGLALRTTYTWDRDGRQLGVTEGAGTAHATSIAYGYDAFGRRTTETLAPGTLNLTTTYAYDANDNVVSRTDASGRVTRYAYDAANRLRFTLDQMSGVSEAAYDAAGRVTMSRRYAKVGNGASLPALPTEAEMAAFVQAQGYANDALDEVSYRVYDGDGRLKLSIDGTGAVQEAVYDSAGRVSKEVRYASSLGLDTARRDALKAGTATLASLGIGSLASSGDHVVRHVYDASSRRRYSVDGTGSVTGLWYDAAGRIVATRAFATRLSPGLVADGITQWQIEGAMGGGAASDAVELFIHDGAGRVRYSMRAVGDAATYPISVSVTETRHDGAGRVLASQTFLSTAVIDLPTAARMSVGTATPADLAAFIAANAGNVQSSRNVYDAAGRLTFQVDGTGGVVRTWYDAAGRVSVRRALAQRIATAGLGDASTVAQLDALLQWGASDDLEMFVYDQAGRARFTLQTVGNPLVFPFTAAVTERTYDGAGRELSTRAFTTPMSLDATLIGKLGAGTAVPADFSAFTAAEASRVQSVRTVYDAAGRATYTLDATGAFTRTWHDAMGRVTAVRRFATPANPATLSDTTSVGQLDAQLVWNAADQSEYRAYDAASRVRVTYNGLGQVTTTDYDGVGRATVARQYATAYFPGASLTDKFFAGTATSADFATFTAANESTARVQAWVYDAGSRVRFALQRGSTGWLVSERSHDGVGRTTADTRYGVTVSFAPGQTEAQVASALNAQLSADAQVRATQVRTTRYVHDAAGRQRFVLDATGALSEQRFDGAGRVVDTRSYLARPAGVATTEQALAAWAQAQPLADVRRVSSTFDAAGRLTARTDALGNSELYTYDGIGRTLTRTDRAGATWTYQYDAAGRRTSELGPAVPVTTVAIDGTRQTTVRSVRTRMEYDAVGNLTRRIEDADQPTARTTDYAYDARGNVIRTTLPDAGVLNETTGVITPSGSRPTIEVTYDTFGRAVVQKDEAGAYRYMVHDTLGRVAFEVDQLGNVTAYGYNAFNEQTSLTRYAASLNTGASAFTSAGWQAGNAITLAQMQGAGSLVGSGNDRTITTAYDALGRKSQVQMPLVTYYTSAGAASTGAPTTRYEYNAYGDVTLEHVLMEGTPDVQGGNAVWATTRRYYDAAGRNTLTVDAEGYVTATDYTATGEVARTVEYARAIPVATLGATAPNLPGAGDPVIGHDRETVITYDILGRKASETSTRIFQRTDGSSGVRGVTTTFGYDAEDRVTSVSAETGTTLTTYAADGRMVSVREQARDVVAAGADGALTGSTATSLASASLYASRSPYTTFAYDAFGAVVASVRHAQGMDGNGQVPADPNDQLDTTLYDGRGRAVWARNAIGSVVITTYDAKGQTIGTRATLTGNDGRTATVRAFITYDAAGRQTATRTEREQFLNGTSQGITDDAHEVAVYNAFGEITSKQHPGVNGMLLYGYDAAGRLVSDNATGATRQYGYNLAGHQVREMRKAKLDVQSAAVDVVTRTQVDRLGRAVAITLPSHTADPATTSLVRQAFDRWGNVLQVVDARGYQTDYQYNQDNQVIREQRPLVWVLGENGAGTWQRPENRWYYDALGRQIGTRDANGNVRTMSYDSVGRMVATTDAFGNVTRQAYDLFGNQALTEDALGYITFRTFDRGNRVVANGDFIANGATRTRHVLQSYALNQAGDRIAVTDALGRTSRYEYDSQQRVLRSLTAEGVETRYTYNVMGRKTAELNALSGVVLGMAPGATYNDADNEAALANALSWDYDVFGRVTDHNMLSTRDVSYVYDAESGQLMSETHSGGMGLVNATAATKDYTYYVNGRIRSIEEPGASKHYFEYDAAGNRVLERTEATDVHGGLVRTITRTTYDSNNRVQRVTQDDVDSSYAILKRVFDLQYDYDANGNRRRVISHSGYGASVDGIVVTNGAPVVVVPPTDRGVKKGQTQEFRLLFSDVFRDAENDALTLSITRGDGSALPAWLTATRDPQTGEIVFTASAPLGTADTDIIVKLTASETANPANSTSTTFTVKLRDNHAPVLLSAAGVTYTAIVGEGFGRDVLASDLFGDIDVGDALTLSVVGTNWPAWLSASTQSPGMLRLSGTPMTAGSYSFTLRATDRSGQSVDKTVTVASLVNNAPTLQSAPAPVVAQVGRSFSWARPLSQLFTDLDGDRLQVTATGLPEWLTFQALTDGATPELRLQGVVPPSEVNGRLYNVQLKATDIHGASVTAVVQITMDGNLGPVAQMTSLVVPTVRVNDTLNMTLSIASLFNDPDGDALLLSVLPPAGSPLWSWLTVDVDRAAGTIRLHGTPRDNAGAGTHAATLVASDPAGLSASIALSFTVTADTAPVRSAAALPDATLSIGRSFNIVLPENLFTDPDGDSLTLSAYWLKQVQTSVGDDPPQLVWVTVEEALPAWMTFNPVTRTLSGTVPAGTSPGSLPVRIRATDTRGLVNALPHDTPAGSAGNTADTDIIFTLQAWTNSAPQYVTGKLTTQTLVHGGAVNLPLPSGSFVEPDGDALSYSAQVQVGGNWVSLSQIGLSIDAATGRITGTATNLVGTSLNARIIATDPQGATATGTFTFTLTNTAPTATTIPVQQVGRNVTWNFALASFFSDVNADALTFSVTGLPAALVLNSTTGVISGQPTVALGSYTVNVTASDGRGGTATTSFTLQVVNSSPVPATIPNQTATAGSSWSYVAPAFTDPNGDTLTYSATGMPAWMTFNATTRTFSGTPRAVGSWTVTLTATDPAGVTASSTFVVSTPNVGPTASTIPAQSIPRNVAWSLGTAGYFADANLDTLTYSATGLPAGLAINATTGVISGTPTTLGSHTVTVTVADGRGGTASATFTVAVTNSVPVYATPLPNRAGQLGAAVSWALPANTFTDANGDALGYTLLVEIPQHQETYWRTPPGEWDTRTVAAQWVPASNAGLSVASNGTISGNLGALNASGQTFYNYRAKLVATDPAGATAEGIFQVGANVAPTAPSVTAPLAKQHVAYTLVLPAFGDANGDTLTYTVSNLPTGLSFNAATRTISGTPTGSGVWTITYSANDGAGGTASMQFSVTVEANTAPVAPTVGSQSGTTGSVFTLTLPAFTDSNGDALAYTIGNLPPGLSFNAATRTISGTPTTVGSWIVTYGANDGRGGTASTTFAFSVAAPVSNQPPVVQTPIPDQSAMGGSPFTYTFPANTFVDPEAGALTYTYSIVSSSILTGWLSFNAATRTFSGTPGAFLDGSVVIRVTATDSQGLSVHDQFELFVSPQESGGNMFMAATEGGSYSFEMGMTEAMATTTTSGGTSGSTNLPVQTQQRWFTYDAENRLRIVNGELVGNAGEAGTHIRIRADVLAETAPGQIEVSDSYGLAYDAAGRATARYSRTTVDGMVRDEVEFTQYTQRGQRRYEFYAQAVGGESSGIARTHTYDAAGQLLETRRYFELGTTKEVWVAPVDRPPGEYTPEMVDVGGWLMYSETYRYDADGRLRWQETRGRETNARIYMGTGGAGDQYDDISLLTFNSRVEYTLADGTDSPDDNASAYDTAGRLTSYRYTGTGPGAPSGFTHTFTMTYEGWGSWQEVRVQGISSVADYKATTNTISLDAFGRITQQSEHTDAEGVKDKIRAYTYNADGAVLTRRHGEWDNGFQQTTKPGHNNEPIPQNYRMVHAAGQQVAELEAGGEVRVSLPSARMAVGDTTATVQGKRSRMSEMNGVAGSGPYSAGGGLVAVMEGETLQGLAQRIYGNAAMWYVLADANGMDSATAQLTAGTRLKAPAVSVNRNDANTFKPYNPAEAIGSTTPSLPYIPPPQEAGCNTMAMIIMIVIAIVVTVVTWGALTGATLGALGTVGTSVAATAVVGAGAAAAGSIVSQGIGSLAGVSSFSWRQVGVDAVVGGLTAGAGVWLKGGGAAPFARAGELAQAAQGVGAGVFKGAAQLASQAGTASASSTAATGGFLSKLGTGQSLTRAGRVAMGVIGYGSSAAANAAFGRDTNFSWKSVATSALGAYIGSYINKDGSYPIMDDATVTGRIVNEAAASFVDGAMSATLTRMAGGPKQNWTSIAINAVSSAAGSELGRGVQSARNLRRESDRLLSEIREVEPNYQIADNLSPEKRIDVLDHDHATIVDGMKPSGAERFKLYGMGTDLENPDALWLTRPVDFTPLSFSATEPSATAQSSVTGRLSGRSLTNAEWHRSYLAGTLHEDGSDILDVTPDGIYDSKDAVYIVGSKDGSLKFGGNGSEYLAYLRRTDRQQYDETKTLFGQADHDRWAIRYNRIQIGLGADPAREAQVRAQNTARNNAEWAQYWEKERAINPHLANRTQTVQRMTYEEVMASDRQFVADAGVGFVKAPISLAYDTYSLLNYPAKKFGLDPISLVYRAAGVDPNVGFAQVEQWLAPKSAGEFVGGMVFNVGSSLPMGGGALTIVRNARGARILTAGGFADDAARANHVREEVAALHRISANIRAGSPARDARVAYQEAIGTAETVGATGGPSTWNRLNTVGRTPGKSSATGRAVIEQMRVDGRYFEDPFLGPQFKASDGEWYPLKLADMSHKVDAATWWNSTGRYYGAKAPEVRTWMLDPANYVLDYYSINRRQGALLGNSGVRYLPPAK